MPAGVGPPHSGWLTCRMRSRSLGIAPASKSRYAKTPSSEMNVRRSRTGNNPLLTITASSLGHVTTLSLR